MRNMMPDMLGLGLQAERMMRIISDCVADMYYSKSVGVTPMASLVQGE